MKQIPDCVPDALTMILDTARAVSDDDFIHRKVLLKVMADIADDGDLGSNAADLYLQCWSTACKALGVRDPFENEKARGNKTALGVLRILAEQFPYSAEEALPTAIKASFAGAMLDFNGLGRADLQEQFIEYFNVQPARDETANLIEAIDKAETVMLVANKAGEIAMDKPLVEYMAQVGKKVYVAVSAKPVFLMATEKDAEATGFSDSVEVINPGTAMYGLIQERASSEFQDLFEEVDLVIVKGCTHYDTLSLQRDLFFILRGIEEGVAAAVGITPSGGAIFSREAGS